MRSSLGNSLGILDIRGRLLRSYMVRHYLDSAPEHPDLQGTIRSMGYMIDFPLGKPADTDIKTTSSRSRMSHGVRNLLQPSPGSIKASERYIPKLGDKSISTGQASNPSGASTLFGDEILRSNHIEPHPLFFTLDHHHPTTP